MLRGLILLSAFFSTVALGTIEVAIMAPAGVQESANELKAQLDDSMDFSINATLVQPSSITSFVDLDDFHVLFIGDLLQDEDQYTLAFAQAVQDFYSDGRGIVASGWFNFGLFRTSGEFQAIIRPTVPNGIEDYVFDGNSAVYEIQSPDHPVFEGISELVLTTANSELVQSVKSDATILAKAGERITIATLENEGRSIYIGAPFLTRPGYRMESMMSGVEDKLIEQAVSWAAGGQAPQTRHTCFNTSSGPKCWGSNSHGQLGQEMTDNLSDQRGETPAELTAIDLGSDFVVKELGTKSNRSCALSVAGRVKCWGGSTHGRLGYGDTASRGDRTGTMGANLMYLDFGDNVGVKQIELGLSHSCVVTMNDDLKCWGRNANGQLGIGIVSDAEGDETNEMGSSLAAVDLPSNTTVQQLALGKEHGCALLSDETLRCWGSNSLGQLGIGSRESIGDEANEMGDQMQTVDLGSNTGPVSKVVVGDDFSCALFENDEAKCWGSNASGQLGIGDVANRGDQPDEMGDKLPYVNLGRGQKMADMSCAGSFCCARLMQGSLKCWGSNKYGQLGYGDTDRRGISSSTIGDELAFVPIPSLSQITDVRAFSKHVCAEAQDGWRCWGDNSFGQLGYADTQLRGGSARATPDLLEPLQL